MIGVGDKAAEEEMERGELTRKEVRLFVKHMCTRDSRCSFCDCRDIDFFEVSLRVSHLAFEQLQIWTAFSLYSWQ